MIFGYLGAKKSKKGLTRSAFQYKIYTLVKAMTEKKAQSPVRDVGSWLKVPRRQTSPIRSRAAREERSRVSALKDIELKTRWHRVYSPLAYA